MSQLEAILDRLDHSRERLLVAIEPLPDELLVTPNAIGRFSIADLLVNFTAWEAELVTGLMRLDQGKKPEHLLTALANRDEYNRKRFEENQGRELDRIFEDLPGVRVQLEGWLEEFSEQDLTDPKRYKWFQDQSLAQIVAQTTYENEEKYLPEIEAFAREYNKQ